MTMRRVNQVESRINKKARDAIKDIETDAERESRMMMIQMLIPLGLKCIEFELQDEVNSLVGKRYSRIGKRKRWGKNPGSVYLGDQKVAIDVPRVRDLDVNQEIQLKSYEYLQNPKIIDRFALVRAMHGLSYGDYEKTSLAVPETFGIKKTSIGRRFIRASAKQLREFQGRELKKYDLVAIFMDGKTLAEMNMIIALGITIDGEKVILGFIEAGTENSVVCRDFLLSLKERGLNLDQDILFIVDGSKGFAKGIKDVVGEHGNIQRCQWHKRENVVKYLPIKQQPYFRRKLQEAYDEKTYEGAKKRLLAVRKELQILNKSAVASLDEGFEETLTLHRLNLFDKLGVSFKTTNCIENVNRLLDKYTKRVTRWQNSDQRQRWFGSALLEIEPRLKKVKGYKYLRELRIAMRAETAQDDNQQKKAA